MQLESGWLVRQIPRQWLRPLDPYWNRVEFFALSDRLSQCYATQTIFPSPHRIFASLQDCSPDEFDSLPTPKVVILAQDPYPNQAYDPITGSAISHANGLAFSVSQGISAPPSLQNIFRELQRDKEVDFRMPSHGDLTEWSSQGVLLLNSVLTVVAGKPNSHQNMGWESFTDGIIQLVSSSCENVVFMLWGKKAQQKATLIDHRKHLVLKTSHPSPNSVHAGFMGCGHFSKANKYLAQHKKAPVNWNLSSAT